MKRSLLLFAFVALPVCAAQLYRWVDEKGNVEWRDTPPPANAKKVETRTVGSNTIETSNMPYSLQQAIKKNPVTLWVFDCGAPCDDAKTHLTRRAIPYTERDVRKNVDELKKLTGSTEAPVLFVGATQLKGYNASAWDTALDDAGYPKSPIPGVKTQVKKDEPKKDEPKASAK
jgi:hypothetical protein